jgi:tetratricopeptide (TPR) repeat protein
VSGRPLAPHIRSSDVFNDRLAAHPNQDGVVDQAAIVTRLADDLENIRRFELARVWLSKAETQIAQADNPALQFSLLLLRLFDAQMHGEYGLAHAYLERRQQLAMTHDYFGAGQEAVENDLGWDEALLLFAESDFHQALPRIQRSYAHAIKRGNMYASTSVARCWGYVALNTGDIQEAAERFRESLLGNFALGDKQAVAACLAAWAALAVEPEISSSLHSGLLIQHSAHICSGCPVLELKTSHPQAVNQYTAASRGGHGDAAGASGV